MILLLMLAFHFSLILVWMGCGRTESNVFSEKAIDAVEVSG